MADLAIVIGNKNYSSWSLRGWLALKQTDADFEEIRIPLDLPNTHAEILKYSPSGRVPALRHGDIWLWESLAIAEYLAETFPESGLWPSDPAARARARAVSAEMHAGFVPLRQHMPMDCRSSWPERGREPGVQEDCDRITTIWRECREQFGGDGDFLFGSFTIADAFFAPVVSRFRTYAVELDPIARAYAAAIWAFPSMQEWLADAENESEMIEEHTL
ncbi:MAG: glutathione S-transferase family protein [Cyanobacteria bacterium P01_F01_bin.33]